MVQDNFENMEDEFDIIMCHFEKITTITKVLTQTLIENSEFDIRDTHNLCGILLEEVKNTKEKLNNFKALEEAYRKAQTAYDEEKIKEEYGIGKIDDYLKDAKQRFGAWSQEITSIKSQISSVSDPAFNDSGKIKTDSSGNIVMENPYTVEINGEKLSPVDDFVRINEIQNMLNIKASKAKSKYDDAMKEPDSNK